MYAPYGRAAASIGSRQLLNGPKRGMKFILLPLLGVHLLARHSDLFFILLCVFLVPTHLLTGHESTALALNAVVHFCDLKIQMTRRQVNLNLEGAEFTNSRIQYLFPPDRSLI